MSGTRIDNIVGIFNRNFRIRNRTRINKQNRERLGNLQPSARVIPSTERVCRFYFAQRGSRRTRDLITSRTQVLVIIGCRAAESLVWENSTGNTSVIIGPRHRPACVRPREYSARCTGNATIVVIARCITRHISNGISVSYCSSLKHSYKSTHGISASNITHRHRSRHLARDRTRQAANTIIVTGHIAYRIRIDNFLRGTGKSADILIGRDIGLCMGIDNRISACANQAANRIGALNQTVFMIGIDDGFRNACNTASKPRSFNVSLDMERVTDIHGFADKATCIFSRSARHASFRRNVKKGIGHACNTANIISLPCYSSAKRATCGSTTDN